MRRLKSKLLNLIIAISIGINVIGVMSFLYSAYAESAYSLEQVPQTIIYYDVKGTATNGKVVVICCSEGLIKTVDIKTKKILFDSNVSNADFNSVIYDGKKFVAITSNKCVVISADGVKWSIEKSNVQLSHIFYGDKKYVGINNGDIYESDNLKNFKLKHSSSLVGYYYISYIGGKYYAFGCKGLYDDTNEVSKSDDLESWQECTLNGSEKVNSNFSGLLSVFNYRGKLCALTAKGTIASINDNDKLKKSLQFTAFPLNSYESGYQIYSVLDKYGILAYDNNKVFFVDSKNNKNIIFQTKYSSNNRSYFQILYDGKQYIYYSMNSSGEFQYYLSMDGVNWNFHKLQIKNVTSFAEGNNILLFILENGKKLKVFSNKHFTDVNIKFPKDFGSKDLIKIDQILYANNKFLMIATFNNYQAVYESSDGINWILKNETKNLLGRAAYFDGKIAIIHSSPHFYMLKDDKIVLCKDNSKLYNSIGIGMFKNKLTSVNYEYYDHGKQYLTFYQSDDGVSWKEISLINVYDKDDRYSGNLLFTSSIFTNNGIILGTSSDKLYIIDDLRTVSRINTYSHDICGGASKKGGSVLLLTSNSLINFNVLEAQTNKANSNCIDVEKVKKFGQEIIPGSEPGCPYNIEVDEAAKDTFAINKITKASINLGENCEIIKYCNGMLYYFYDGKKEIRYIKNGVVNIIGKLKDQAPTILIANKLYYLQNQDLYSLTLEDAKTHIEINSSDYGEDSTNSESSTINSGTAATGVIYMDKDKVIYTAVSNIYVEKSGSKKQLISNDDSFISYKNYLDSTNISQDKNMYYYGGMLNTFIYNSKIYFVSNGGLYCYDLKNESCKRIINTCILNYSINMISRYAPDEPSYMGGYALNKQFMYINESGDIIQLDLQSEKGKIIVPNEKVPDNLKGNGSITSISADNDNAYIEIISEIGQQMYDQILYTYNFKSAKMTCEELHKDS